MSGSLDPQLKRTLAERIRFYHELGIYDFYRRETAGAAASETAEPVATRRAELPPVPQPEQRGEMTPAPRIAVAIPVEEDLFAPPKPEAGVTDPARALRLIREDLGDCTRCRLHKQGRKQIVFGVGSPKAELMFIGEAPGADEDEQG